MIDKLKAIEERFHYLEEKMTDPEVITDIKQFTKINKEYKDIKPVVETYHSFANLLGNIETSQEMLKDSDPEMK